MHVHPLVLISGSDLVKHWRVAHKLNAFSPNLSVFDGSLKHWRATHSLDACSPVLISGSDIVKHWRVTHILDACSPNLVRGLIWSNTGEQLTYWMHVHPILSVFSSGQRLESDSQTGYILISGLVLIHSITREQLTN